VPESSVNCVHGRTLAGTLFNTSPTFSFHIFPQPQVHILAQLHFTMQRAVQSFARLAQAHPPMTRAFALEGTRFSEGEKAIEDLFFSKEDQRLMTKLLLKVRDQTARPRTCHGRGWAAARRSSGLAKIGILANLPCACQYATAIAARASSVFSGTMSGQSAPFAFGFALSSCFSFVAIGCLAE
jgi:hypothetical protein